jgi:hypothetical protein
MKAGSRLRTVERIVLILAVLWILLLLIQHL